MRSAGGWKWEGGRTSLHHRNGREESLEEDGIESRRRVERGLGRKGRRQENPRKSQKLVKGLRS